MPGRFIKDEKVFISGPVRTGRLEGLPKQYVMLSVGMETNMAANMQR
jgi:hypothetical protein